MSVDVVILHFCYILFTNLKMFKFLLWCVIVIDIDVIYRGIIWEEMDTLDRMVRNF